MKFGDLVGLCVYAPHSSTESKRVIYKGLYVQEAENEWTVFVEGEMKKFSKIWWDCKKVY